MSGNYEVGYGKPPKKSQFKPGESGNKKGRPKGAKNTSVLLKEIADSKVSIVENGQTKKVAKRAAVLMQLINKSIKGDTKAINILLPRLFETDAKEEERAAVIEQLSKGDEDIANDFMARMEEHYNDKKQK